MCIALEGTGFVRDETRTGHVIQESFMLGWENFDGSGRICGLGFVFDSVSIGIVY